MMIMKITDNDDNDNRICNDNDKNGCAKKRKKKSERKIR